MSRRIELAVPLPKRGKVVTWQPIPVIVTRGVAGIVAFVVLAGGSFALLNSVAADHAYPTPTDVTRGLAVAILWPIAGALHEAGHAVTGALVGRPPVWIRIGLVPGVALTPPPVERWARVLVSGSGPMLEIAAGALFIALNPGAGANQFLTDPVAIIGAVCVLNGASNLIPGPKNTDGGKLWCAVWRMARRARTPPSPLPARLDHERPTAPDRDHGKPTNGPSRGHEDGVRGS